MDDMGKFSLTEQAQKRRLENFLRNMRQFKLFNSEKLPQPEHSEAKIYAITIKDMAPALRLPEKYQGPKFTASLMINCTLCQPGIGLFGRTSRLQQVNDKKEPVK